MNKSLIVISVGIVIIILIAFPKQLVDDTAILWRYADNFKETGQLVWNNGDFLQGYTGVLLLLIFIASPVNYLLTGYIISIIAFFAGGWFIHKLIKDNHVKYFILFCYFFSPVVYTHIFAGLETVLFTTLTLSSFYFWKTGNKYALLGSLILMSLCRPEGIMFSILLLI